MNYKVNGKQKRTHINNFAVTSFNYLLLFCLNFLLFLKKHCSPKEKNNYTVVITMLVAVYSEEKKINILHGVNLRMNKLSL